MATKELHPFVFEADDKGSLRVHSHLLRVCKAIAATLPFWPRTQLPAPSARGSKQKKRKPLPGVRWHEWVSDGVVARCSACLLVSAEADLASRSMVGCKQLPASMQRVLRHPNGHKLSVTSVFRANANKPPCSLIFCSACGAYARRKPVLLLEPCSGVAAPNAGAICLAKIRDRRPPWEVSKASSSNGTLDGPVRHMSVIPVAANPQLAQSSSSASVRFQELLTRIRDNSGQSDCNV